MDMRSLFRTKQAIPLGILILTLFLIGTPKLYAAYDSGGSITYTHISGLTYRVTLFLYYDCAGINMGSMSIDVSEGRCGNVVMRTPLVSPARLDTQSNNPPSYPSRFVCTSAINPQYPETRTNFRMATYIWTVTLPSRRADWCFSYASGARADIGNLGNGSNGNHYLEARLNNLDVLSNTSAQINAVDYTNPYICVDQPYYRSFAAVDPDGDSLAYSMFEPMLTCSTRTTYANYPARFYIDTNQVPNLLGQLPAGTYSATNPIQSFDLIPNPSRIVNTFRLDRSTGGLSFRPRFHTPTANRFDGINRYAMAVKVQEYRRLGTGPAVLVGETMQEFFVTVRDCGANRPPLLDNGRATNLNPLARVLLLDSSTIEVRVAGCNSQTVLVPFRDPNVGSNVSIWYDSRQRPGFVNNISMVGQNTIGAQLSLSLGPLTGSTKASFELPIRITDDYIPMVGYRSYLLRLLVDGDSAGAQVTAVGNQLTTPNIPGALYQWFLNGAPIPNATNSSILFSQDGKYRVRVTDQNCVTSGFYSVITQLSATQLQASITLYPNPASQHTKIKAPAEIWAKVQSVEVVNALGQVVLSQPAQQDDDGQMTLPLTGLKSGQYWLRFGGLGVGKVLVVE